MFSQPPASPPSLPFEETTKPYDLGVGKLWHTLLQPVERISVRFFGIFDSFP